MIKVLSLEKMESLIKPTVNLVNFLKKADSSIDLSESRFLFPIELLPIAALISEKSLKYVKPEEVKCREYLDYFNFPNGLTKFEPLSSSYIPIYKFSTPKSDLKSLQDKSNILQSIIGICLSKIGTRPGAIDVLNYIVYEIIDNIEEHSEAKYGWINAQYYPKKQYLDLCILDRGITVLGKYRKSGKVIPDDLSALKNALQGVSTKPERIRGTGIRTFVNMICGAFGGEIEIISGNAIAFASKNNEPRIEKLSIRWEGTIIAVRIPKGSASMNYQNYIE
jgi:hypothetical protein